MQSAFITGASGFVGRHLVRELVGAGYGVTGLVRGSNQSESVRSLGADAIVGDLTDPSLVLGSLPPETVVFHLAAALTTWAQGIQEGQRSTSNLVTQMRKQGIRRLVYVSSAAVHSPSHGLSIVDEASPVAPHPSWDHYVTQKLLCEGIVAKAHQEGVIQATVVRPTKVLGPGDRNLVPWATKLSTWVGGAVADDWNCRHPVVVVEEVARGIVASAGSQCVGRTYYVSSTKQITKQQLVDAFLSAGMNLHRPRRAKAIATALGAAAIRTLDSPWRFGLIPSEGPSSRAVAALERRASRHVDHDCVISTAHAATDFEWKGEADIIDAIKRAVDWHLGSILVASATSPSSNSREKASR